jgi:hypothetical protein
MQSLVVSISLLSRDGPPGWLSSKCSDGLVNFLEMCQHFQLKQLWYADCRLPNVGVLCSTVPYLRVLACTATPPWPPVHRPALCITRAPVAGQGVRRLFGWTKDVPLQEERARLLREVGARSLLFMSLRALAQAHARAFLAHSALSTCRPVSQSAGV